MGDTLKARLLEDLLARADEAKARAEVARDTEMEALDRARVVEILARASLLLSELVRIGHAPLVSDPTELDGFRTFDLSGDLASADREYLRAHHFARGWFAAQPEAAQRVRSIGLAFETRLEADTALIAVPFDLEGRSDLSADELYSISATALRYQPGHGWHLRISHSELEDVIERRGAPRDATQATVPPQLGYAPRA